MENGCANGEIVDSSKKTDDRSLQNGEIKEKPDTNQPCQLVKKAERTQEEWISRERDLLKKIVDLEKRNYDTLSDLNSEIKTKNEENEFLRAKLSTLETELKAVMKKPNSKNKNMIEDIRKHHEELLTKARGMIFEKTKMITNQELQMDAMNTQVESMKDIIKITKDMLEIKNAEVIHLQSRLDYMDLKLQAEKDKQALLEKKLESSKQLSETLRSEYNKQQYIFKELKEKYEEKIAAVKIEKANMENEVSAEPQDS